METISENTQTERVSRVDCIHSDRNTRLSAKPEPELPEQVPPQPDTPLKVVLAYDDDDALRAAMEIYRAVVQKLAPDFEFRDSWWKFGAFTEPTLLEQAVKVAAVADIIFCCPSNPYSLPRSVQDWFQRWLTRRTLADGALVVMLPVTAEKSSYQTPLEKDLRETARVGGLEFFAAGYMPDRLPTPTSHAPTTPTGFDEDLDVIGVAQGGPT